MRIDRRMTNALTAYVVNNSCTLYDSRRFVIECRSESLRSIGVSVPRFRGYFPLWRLSVPALHASASCLAPPLLSVVCL